MTADQVCQSIQARFGESVVISEFSPKSWLMDEKTKEPWRDYLLSMFRRRLLGADSRGVAKHVIEETKGFLHEVERFTPEQTLYSFSASSASNVYAGWAIDDRIAFCIPNKK
jgi:hypothetical protein